MSDKSQRQKITPFFWFDNRAEEAMEFYVSTFRNSGVLSRKKWPEKSPFPPDSSKPGTLQTGAFILDGVKFYAFDAGPMFRFNSSISFFVMYEDAAEIDRLWNLLVEGGEVLMPLDSYRWSKKYGWLKDRYGITWQLSVDDRNRISQRIAPLLMFSGRQRGKASEALELYSSVFPDSAIDTVFKYEKGEPGPVGMVKHARCTLAGETFMLMDSGVENNIPFTEAISLFVACMDQQEVDYYWDKLSDGGEESACGWVKDKFGVSWQIVPVLVFEKLSQGDSDRSQRMMKALSRMGKLDVATLENAYNSTRD